MSANNIVLEEFFEKKNENEKTFHITIKPMTMEQARQAYKSRPFSKYAESRFGGNELYDDFALKLNGLAGRCKMCQAVTKSKFLGKENVCPDCNGSAESLGLGDHRTV